MENSKTHMFLETLETVLNQERKALLAGDFEDLPNLLEAKERLLQNFQSTQITNPETLAKTHDLVSRNQTILDGALRGIRDVTNRLKTLQNVRDSLETYGNDGRRFSVPNQTNSRLEKRA